MTLRSIILGLIGTAFVCSYTYLNDHVMRQTPFVGNNMPIAVYGFLVIFLIFIYPLLRRIHARMCLSRKELAIILIMTLTACAVPGSNLLRFFTPALVMPHRFAKTQPGWQKQGVMKMVPDGMLVDVSQDEDTVLNGFTRGLGEGNKHIKFSQVPWKAWQGTMMFWIPIILSLWIAMIGLATVVHRQWVKHEHLPYPIVNFATSLFPNKNGQRNSIFNNKIFWIGLISVLVIHSYNYLVMWFPDQLMGKIPVGVDFSSISKLFPNFEKGGGQSFLKDFHQIYFTVVAVAYFLPKDVSLSLGIGPFIWIYISGLLTSYGIGSTGWQGGWPFGIKSDQMFIAGAYFATLLVLLFTGRRYYSTVFLKAIGLPAKDEAERSSIYGARVFIFAMIMFTAYTSLNTAMDWPLALMFGLVAISIYLVIGRIIAETGLFFVQIIGVPATVMWAFLGAKALGPEVMLVIFMFSLILFYDTREALMPFIINNLKLAEDCRLKIGKAAMIAVVALCIGLAVGIPITLYFQYDQGIDLSAWHNEQPQQPFNEVIGAMQRLEAQGQLEVAGQVGGLKRFANISPHKPAMITFAIAAGCVLLFSTLRLRFAKWPFHPVMFLVCSIYTGKCFAQSFMLGWFIKIVISKYGGATIYQKLKPLMFGMIAGEMLGGLIPTAISLVYYLITKDLPKSFLVMPQ